MARLRKRSIRQRSIYKIEDEPEDSLIALPLPCAKGFRADYVERSLAGLIELVISLAVRIAIINRIRIAITQAHITGLNVTTMACQHGVDCRKCLLRRHALGELVLHQGPDLLCANSPRDTPRQAHTFEKTIEHKGIRRTHVRLTVGKVALVMGKRRAPRMHEQVASGRKVLDYVCLSPDGCHRVLRLPCLMAVPPCHTPAISLPALAMQPGTVLTHLRKLHYEGSHIARCGRGKQ
jgi:hypothetical protein